jgi:hypothetical protein
MQENLAAGGRGVTSSDGTGWINRALQAAGLAAIQSRGGEPAATLGQGVGRSCHRDGLTGGSVEWAQPGGSRGWPRVGVP